MKGSFSYDAAFARNLGLVTEAEQARLRQTCVGLPGMGGVGGAHLQTLARLGIGAFHLADPDTFDQANLNRQCGATTTTLGRAKVDVLAEMARSINPEARVRSFPDGVTADNTTDFLDGVDVVVDGIEFFAIEARRRLYAACRRRGIPVIQAGPIGYGAAVLVFLPTGPSFDAHFGIDDAMTRAEMLLAHALGHGAALRQDIDPTRVDLEKQKGPALASACLLCAATAATELLKLRCNRGPVMAAPHGVYYDPFRGRTLALRPVPSMRTSLRGRLLRWLSFRRIPALRTLHERELAARCGASKRTPEAVLIS